MSKKIVVKKMSDKDREEAIEFLSACIDAADEISGKFEDMIEALKATSKKGKKKGKKSVPTHYERTDITETTTFGHYL